MEVTDCGIRFPSGLPKPATERGDVPRAPRRPMPLSSADQRRALANALRYFAPEHHSELAPEFAKELKMFGHIYCFRFRPAEVFARPLRDYAGKSVHARCIMMMIDNNLDPNVAQFPYELVTYGGNGQVFSNWAQYRLTMHYLSVMSDEQTLVLASGHPQGLFPSPPDGPIVVVTNGMVIPNYSKRSDYDELFALGVSQYGQMTAGSFSYIGPQGIVHGTTLSILNASRKWLGSSNLAGKVFVTSGLGGMSGAQGKAAFIAGCIGIIVEVDAIPLQKRYAQGWLTEVIEGDLDALVQRVRTLRQEKTAAAIGFLGNVVDVWERFASEKNHLVDLGSDQTSCHNPFLGGYFPAGLSVQESRTMMTENPSRFKELVQESLCRQVSAINKLSARGQFYFYDYGNAFMLEAERANADISGSSNGRRFRYLSYIEAFMGDIFSLGFGPFRWVCTSGSPEDLAKTDEIAIQHLREALSREDEPEVKANLGDNLRWMQGAQEAKMVVGTQARILYSDAQRRSSIAVAINAAVSAGAISSPVVISRDHHDVSGTDSPYRETSDVRDGSQRCADMSVQNVIGDAMRGATWVSLHNGGGTGWGESINGGFGMVLDGTEKAEARAKQMLLWDVLNGVSRRAWAGNDGAIRTILRAQKHCDGLQLTVPQIADSSLLVSALGSEGGG